jgi:hypothetical protein
MSLRWHEPTSPRLGPAPDLSAGTHRSRLALEDVLTNPGDDHAWARLAGTYDEMAQEWSAWAVTQPGYAATVRDGLRAASRDEAPGWAFEVSCGTGQATEVLAGAVARTLSSDVNISMLRGASEYPTVRYLAADVRHLPLRTGTVPLLVGLNAVPHVAEFERVLAPDGQLLWCTSFGAGTPLYVAPERLLDLFGAGWSGEAAQAGHGEWTLLRRVH